MGPAAPSRPQPGTTNPSKEESFLEGFVVPQGGRRASGRRSGSGSDAEHLARQSPKNVAQAHRFLGLAGAADRGDPPQPTMAAGVARATGGSSAVRTPARYPAQPPGRFGHGGSQ